MPTGITDQLSTLLASGMAVLPALDAIAADARSPRLRRHVGRLRDAVAEGFPLWEALARERMVAASGIALIRTGESSGRLREHLALLAEQEQKAQMFRQRLRSAMLYPVAVLILAALVGLGVAWFILPRLAGVFTSLHVDLPPLTRALIAMGTFLGTYGFIAVPTAMVTIVVVWYFAFWFRRTRRIGQAFLSVIPGVRQLIREVELARFGSSVGALLRAGLPITAALDAAREATPLHRYQVHYQRLRDHLADGFSFEESFERDPRSRACMPISIQRLLASAARSGQLPDALERVGSQHEARVEVTAKSLATILEPILLVLVWVGVMFVALAVILPIYSLVGAVR